MTSEIDFKSFQDENEQNFEEFAFTKHYSQELTKKFGTFLNWDERDVSYLLEQLNNHFFECNEEGSFPALVALDTAISCYQSSDEVCKSAFLHAIATTRGYFSKSVDRDADEVKVFDVISKYENAYRVFELVQELTKSRIS